MNMNIPWIISRRRFLLAVFIDFLINFLIYEMLFYREFVAYPNSIVTLSISSFWIILSYILGRYMVCRKINNVEIIRTVFKSLFVFFASMPVFIALKAIYKTKHNIKPIKV